MEDHSSEIHNKMKSLASLDMITEVRETMKKLIEDKVVDLEFNLNNKLVTRMERIEKE